MNTNEILELRRAELKLMGCTEVVLHADRSVAKASEFAAMKVREAEIVLTRHCAAKPDERFTAPEEYYRMLDQAREADLYTTGQMVSLMIDLECGEMSDESLILF